MTTYYDDQARRDAMRLAADAAERTERERQNAIDKAYNESKAEQERQAQREREAVASAQREAEFKQQIRAEYPALDDKTFEAEWPRLRVQALEQRSAAILAAKRAEYAPHF